MAKKTKTFSDSAAENALEQLAANKPSAFEVAFELLRVFANYGEGQIARIKDGRGNKASDGRTILVPRLLAFRTKGELGFLDEIQAMRSEKKIAAQNPRLYIVCDGSKIAAYDPVEDDTNEIGIDALWKDFAFFRPLAGIEKVKAVEENEADVRSAEKMAKISDEIRRHNDVRDPAKIHCINVFLSRLLFCLFAEDTGLFAEPNMFTNYVKTHTSEDGADLADFIGRAFSAMAMAESERAKLDELPSFYRKFPYVNGGLFREQTDIPTLSGRARRLIIQCGDFNWHSINPDIFGSMIQAVASPEKRGTLGMHYTSIPNIIKVISPLFLDSLTEEFAAARTAANAKKLRQLLARIGRIKFFDPACGSGNFLITTYKRLRELEIRIGQALAEITGQSELPFSSISLQQFYGIEIDDFACDTAKLSLWLAEHQMNHAFDLAFGTSTNYLPLNPSGNIVQGNACRLDWNAVCPHSPDEEVYVMGNPPYRGSKKQDASQKADLDVALSELKHKRTLDYIAAWFWLGAKYAKGTMAKYAFVTTNSISQGEQVDMLWHPIFDLGLEIDFARTSFRWANNAKNNAAVSVAVIGVANRSNAQKRLFVESRNIEWRVDRINPYLAASDAMSVAKKLTPPTGLPEIDFGCMPYDNGNLLLDSNEREELLDAYPSAEKFVLPIMGSKEFINDIPRYCLWISDADIEEAMSIPPIAERIERTRQFRLYESKDGGKLAERPHQFREYYDIPKKPVNKIIVPRVSSERRVLIPMGYISSDTIVSDSAFEINDAPEWIFAILTSTMHNVWVRAVGGKLESRIRYSAGLCYNTFPFPRPTEEEKERLRELAEGVILAREYCVGMTLADLYNPETMPAALREAHSALDEAVERLYRREPFASDEERLSHLFRLYSRMSNQ